MFVAQPVMLCAPASSATETLAPGTNDGALFGDDEFSTVAIKVKEVLAPSISVAVTSMLELP